MATTFTGTSGPGETSRPISSATIAMSSEPVARDAVPAQGGGDEHRRPAELGAATPPLRVEADRAGGQLPHLGERGLLLEEVPGRVAEQELIGREVVLHGLSFLRGYRARSEFWQGQ